MHRLRAITIVVLGLLTLAGLLSGLALLTDSSGARLGLAVEQLPKWPLLGTYLVPGALLVLLFGVLPLLAARLVVRRSPNGWTWTTGVGLLLIAWMAVQIAAIGLPKPAVQAGFLIVGILLTGLGMDGGASAADEYRRPARSYPQADDEPRPRPAGSRGGPDHGRGPRPPADRSDSLY